MSPLVKSVLALLGAAVLANHLSAQVPAYPTWDPRPVVATQNIQLAVDSGASTVVLVQPPGGLPWVIRTVNLLQRDGLTLEFEPGVVIENDKIWAGQTNGDDMFSVRECSHITLAGDALNPAWIDFQSAVHFSMKQGHCFELVECNDVQIENLLVTSNTGDGIALSHYPSTTSSGEPNQDITILNCQAWTCARGGLTISHALNVLVQDCVFNDTGVPLLPGEDGGWGVDIEPDFADADLFNIDFVDCQASGNTKDAFRLFLHLLDETSSSLSVSFTGCSVEENLGIAYGLNIVDAEEPLQGLVAFTSCTADKVDGAGALVFGCTTPSNFKVIFDSCSWSSVARDFDALDPTYPFYLASTEDDFSSPDSGIDFINCTLDDRLERQFANLNGKVAHLGEFADIEGNIAVTNPNIIEFPPTTLVNLDVAYN